MELAILSTMETVAHCRLLGSEHRVTFRARTWGLVPGEIIVVKPGKQWTYGRTAYVSGEIESTRLDVAALELAPLRLKDRGLWEPAGHGWGESDEPLDDLARAMIAWGPRREYEMEQVLPGTKPGGYSDPICDSNDLKAAGDYVGARSMLMELCRADLRCLDAHNHLGNLLLDRLPAEAIRHYEVGVRIAELSLGERFDGLLPWGMIDNRPFLRCLRGFGLCKRRLGKLDEAARVFDRLLWFNPSDNQGVRFMNGSGSDD